MEQISLTDEDARYRERLCASDERPGVLAWAVRGWEAYARDPDLEAPATTWEAREEFLSALSEFDRFVTDCCEIGNEYSVLPLELYQVYKIWCLGNGVKAETNYKLAGYLEGRGFRKMSKWVDGKVIKVRLGIRAKMGQNA
jgi:putative DNA primase/helicase